MIHVKLLGGIKKLVGRNTLEFNDVPKNVYELLAIIQQCVPDQSNKIDTTNILVAVNGVDTTALQGENTILSDGDVVTIIPLVHGGNYEHQFSISNWTILVLTMKKMNEPISFLDLLRTIFPSLKIQGIREKYILNFSHAKKILTISLTANKENTMLSNKIEMDILMRFAGTRQISDAILKAGIRKNENFVLIAIGKKYILDKLLEKTKENLSKSTKKKNHARMIEKEFGITDTQIKSVLSKTPLEDILAERSATLFS